MFLSGLSMYVKSPYNVCQCVKQRYIYQYKLCRSLVSSTGVRHLANFSISRAHPLISTRCLLFSGVLPRCNANENLKYFDDRVALLANRKSHVDFIAYNFDPAPKLWWNYWSKCVKFIKTFQPWVFITNDRRRRAIRIRKYLKVGFFTSPSSSHIRTCFSNTPQETLWHFTAWQESTSVCYITRLSHSIACYPVYTFIKPTRRKYSRIEMPFDSRLPYSPCSIPSLIQFSN